MKLITPLMTLLLLVGCTVNAPSISEPDLIRDTQVLDEEFIQSGDWSLYATESFTATVTDGVYRMLLQQPNQYIWGTNEERYSDTVIDVDVTWQSTNPTAFAGIVCRLNPVDSTGYYVLVSKSGEYSIRYARRNADDALISWRTHRRIPEQGTFQMQVACVDNFIGLYINGDYINGSIDTRLNRGQLGLVVGMPQTGSGDGIALADFDNLRVWNATIESP